MLLYISLTMIYDYYEDRIQQNNLGLKIAEILFVFLKKKVTKKAFIMRLIINEKGRVQIQFLLRNNRSSIFSRKLIEDQIKELLIKY